MAVLTEATKERQRLERLKRMTLQERMLADHNKRLEREKNKQTFSAQDAEKTAENIAGDSEKRGFFSEMYSELGNVTSDVGDSISRGAKMAGDAWDQGFEWNPGKKKLSSNEERIMSEYEAGGSTAIACQ